MNTHTHNIYIFSLAINLPPTPVFKVSLKPDEKGFCVVSFESPPANVSQWLGVPGGLLSFSRPDFITNFAAL